MDAFEMHVRAGLERAGLPLEDVELEIMRFIERVFGPELAALAEADLRGAWAEIPLDPGSAPRS